MTQIYFKPSSPLRFDTVSGLRSDFSAWLAQQPACTAVRCDLTAVQSCDSAGLAFLIDLKRLCSGQSRALVIDHPSAGVLALAKLYGIESILDNGEEL